MGELCLMSLLLADKVTHLTAARYFAARGFDWLFFDLTDPSVMTPARYLAIREWVEGPRTALYLPMGIRDPQAAIWAEQLKPDGWVIGHFSKPENMSLPGPVFKEWLIQDPADAGQLADQLKLWPREYFHLIKPSSVLAANQLAHWLRNSGLEPWMESIFIHVSLPPGDKTSPPEWPTAAGYVLVSPEEDQVGLLSFDALDDFLDRMQES